jgi:hypothetical protein
MGSTSALQSFHSSAVIGMGLSIAACSNIAGLGDYGEYSQCSDFGCDAAAPHDAGGPGAGRASDGSGGSQPTVQLRADAETDASFGTPIGDGSVSAGGEGGAAAWDDGSSAGSDAAGFPAGPVVAFGYTTSSFTSTSYAPPSGATTDCDATYSSTSGSFTAGSCAGTAPTIVHGLAQTGGGPVVDILAFSSLTIAIGSTLRLTGSNPVIVAVYGNAVINGTIDASATGTTPGAGGDNATYCGTGAAGAGGINGASGGGGGGKAVAGGLGSCGGQSCSGNGTTAGGAASPTQLAGGCAGGPGQHGYSGGSTTPAGAGGGAVEIAVAGIITGSGAITADGAAGQNASCGAPGAGAQNDPGGGGGGSGGEILLYGATGSTLTGITLSANGGAGGNAAGTTSGGEVCGKNAGGTAGTNDGTTQVAPGNAPPVGAINSNGGGGGGSYGIIVTSTSLAAPATE